MGFAWRGVFSYSPGDGCSRRPALLCGPSVSPKPHGVNVIAPHCDQSGRPGWPSGPSEGYRSVFPTPMAIPSPLPPCTGKGSQQLTGLRAPGDRRLRQRLDPHPHPPARRVPASPAPYLLEHLPWRLQQLCWRPRPARVTCPRVTRSRSPAEGLPAGSWLPDFALSGASYPLISSPGARRPGSSCGRRGLDTGFVQPGDLGAPGGS